MIKVELLNDWSYVVTLDTLIFLGFFAACFVTFYAGRNRSRKVASVMYCISYAFSYFRGELTKSQDGFFALDAYYLNWVLYDAVTIFSIYIIHTILKAQHSKIVILAYCLSLINMISYLIMHYLAFVQRYESHWYYVVYSSTINVTALVIIFSFMFLSDRRLTSRCTPYYR